jgi:hypothetical protein
MRTAIIVVVLALMALVIYWLAHSSDKTPPVASPGAVIGDAISVQLDAKTRGGTAVRILAMRDELKQLIALDTFDGDSTKQTLQSFDELKGDVQKAREELITRGASAAEVDHWLANNHWAETIALAEQVRAKATPAPAQ